LHRLIETPGDEVVAVENPPIAANSTGPLKHLALFIEPTISRYVRPAVFCRILRNPHRWGLEILCQEPAEYSPVLTAVLMPPGHDADQFRKVVLDNFNMSLGAGLSKLAGKVFRIGHLGECNDLVLMGALTGVEMGLAAAGVPHRAGGVAAAMRELEAGDMTNSPSLRAVGWFGQQPQELSALKSHGVSSNCERREPFGCREESGERNFKKALLIGNGQEWPARFPHALLAVAFNILWDNEHRRSSAGLGRGRV
jgi:hypothetical protein